MSSMFCIIIDIDWAPDFMIEHVTSLLSKRNIKATWFITHQSPAIEKLKQYPDIFELGIHPNFLPDSTQGNSIEEILDNCLSIVPGASCMRMHSLLSSTPLLSRVIAHAPQLSRDVTLFLPHMPNIHPVEFFWKGNNLLRIPTFWEDDLELERPNPCWSLKCLSESEGLKVLAFHPMHIYLNTNSLIPYEVIKLSVESILKVKEEDLRSHVQTDEGAGTMFHNLTDHLAESSKGILIREIQ